LYGYEAWSLTLKEQHRLKIFENRLLRRIFGPKKEEGSWTTDWTIRVLGFDSRLELGILLFITASSTALGPT
jgi:hypothetical protein